MENNELDENINKLALEKYPVDMGYFVFNKDGANEILEAFDENEDKREGFIAGYKECFTTLLNKPIQGIDPDKVIKCSPRIYKDNKRDITK